MPIPHARRMNLIALALLITALVAFIAFHLLVFTIYTATYEVSKSLEFGWQLWPELMDFLKDADFDNVPGMIGASAILTHSLLVVVSPFITNVLRTSRTSWWITAISSGVAMCGLGGIVILIAGSDPFFSIPGPGLYCLLASLALNFLGLLFIRRQLPAAPEADLA